MLAEVTHGTDMVQVKACSESYYRFKMWEPFVDNCTERIDRGKGVEGRRRRNWRIMKNCLHVEKDGCMKAKYMRIKDEELGSERRFEWEESRRKVKTKDVVLLPSHSTTQLHNQENRILYTS